MITLRKLRMSEKKVYPSVKALIVEGKKFLLILNDDNRWEFPGGKVNYGETPFEALNREIKEEIGIEIEILEPVGFAWSLTEAREVVMTVVKCKAKSKEYDLTKNPADEDIQEIRFFTKKEFLDEKIIAAHYNMKELIKDLKL